MSREACESELAGPARPSVLRPACLPTGAASLGKAVRPSSPDALSPLGLIVLKIQGKEGA